MKCLECGAEIENGIYLCGYCGQSFSEEDIEVMLRLNKKYRKKRVRRNLMLTLFVSLVVAAGFGGWCYYFAKKAEYRLVESKEEYFKGMDKYLSSMEDIYSYDYSDENICLIIERGVWDEISETEKHNFADRVQRELYSIKYDAGYKQTSVPMLQINSVEGDIMLIIDKAGNIQTF